jgi:hypothetical protein
MGSSSLLRLADIGIFPRSIERYVRERRFRAFWDNVDEAPPGVTLPDVEAETAQHVAPSARAAGAPLG